MKYGFLFFGEMSLGVLRCIDFTMSLVKVRCSMSLLAGVDDPDYTFVFRTKQ